MKVFVVSMSALVFAVLFMACHSVNTSEQNDPLRVMSYNIRYANEGDGVNAWSKRRSRFVDYLKSFDADVIGVQEAIASQMNDLSDGMTEYEYVGKGRDDGKEEGEYCGIFFKSKVFDVIEDGQFWLSDQPDVPGSVGWDAALTRIATWVKLKHKKDGSQLFVLNGHFDHRGTKAREESAKLIMDKVSEISDQMPSVILGDFNATPQTKTYSNFISSSNSKVVYDSYDLCKEKTGRQGTWQGFDIGEDSKRRIDYVFLSEGLSCNSYHSPADEIIPSDGSKASSYYSDHLPVIIDIK